jgi:hypothetical protein
MSNDTGIGHSEFAPAGNTRFLLAFSYSLELVISSQYDLMQTTKRAPLEVDERSQAK